MVDCQQLHCFFITWSFHKYGWSATFDKTEDGYWYVDVTVGLHGTRRFVAAESNSMESPKEGAQVTSAWPWKG